MAADAEEFESHFVENPFIRMREKQKQADGKTRLGAKQLIAGTALEDQLMEEDEAEKQDIFMIKETGKFVINDLEAKKPKLIGKRGRTDMAKDHEESDAGSSVGDNISGDEDSDDNEDLRTKMRSATKRQKVNDDGNYKLRQDMKRGVARKTPGEGHIVKYSASAYKS